jgi:hypothetical protein
MINEQYNGLSSGRGKDVVVQLLRAFSNSGYPLDEGAWLRAFFAAGGTFPHADRQGTGLAWRERHGVPPGLAVRR